MSQFIHEKQLRLRAKHFIRQVEFATTKPNHFPISHSRLGVGSLANLIKIPSAFFDFRDMLKYFTKIKTWKRDLLAKSNFLSFDVLPESLRSGWRKWQHAWDLGHITHYKRPRCESLWKSHKAPWISFWARSKAEADRLHKWLEEIISLSYYSRHVLRAEGHL